jgi:hypothetical protein
MLKSSTKLHSRKNTHPKGVKEKEKMNEQQERGAMSNQDTTPKMHKWGLISRLFDLMYLFFLVLPTQSNSKKGCLVG